MKRISVLGAGSFGTALAVNLAQAGHEVGLWARRREVFDELVATRRNDFYLPGIELPRSVTPAYRLEDLVAGEVVLMAVPSHGFRQVVGEFLRLHPGGRPVTLVSTTKGVEIETLARMSEVSFEEGEASGREVHFAVLSGPTFAAELARGMASVAVIASAKDDLAPELQTELAAPNLRLYTSSDVVGVELGGASKNVIAIAAGVVAGLELGHNTLAALITRGLHEITRLTTAYGGQPQTMAGLAGLGDLVLTCTGGLSRNRAIGVALAEGKGVGKATGETHMVAEGVRNSLAISRLAERREVDMPIVEQMVKVLYEGRHPAQALQDLMRRELKSEAEL